MIDTKFPNGIESFDELNKRIMNENINLCELLKGHEGEIFYSPIYGNVKLSEIYNSELITITNFYCENTHLNKHGECVNYNGAECIIFPSKDQRDWNKWEEEQKCKTPKTFNEIPLKDRDYFIRNIPGFELSKRQKSALALLKIYQLIEVGYGGNITNKEWDNEDIPKYTIKARCNDIVPCDIYIIKNHIAFHTKQQRDEFLSYPENVQLIRDFYMIP